MTVLILSREKTYGERVFHPRMSKVIVGLQPGICVRQKRRRKKEVNRTDYFFFFSWFAIVWEQLGRRIYSEIKNA